MKVKMLLDSPQFSDASAESELSAFCTKNSLFILVLVITGHNTQQEGGRNSLLSMIGVMPMISDTNSFLPCFSSHPKTKLGVKMGLLVGMKRVKRSSTNLKLSTGFSNGAWCARILSTIAGCSHPRQNKLSFVVVNELGGQYEEVFNDVKSQLRDYFTAKAVRTLLHQLYEMNPPQYIWLHNFLATNDPKEGKEFLRTLAKENLSLAERLMITRLHLYGKWIKQCDHAEIYQEISDENLELMRERLMETIVWPSDDINT